MRTAFVCTVLLLGVLRSEGGCAVKNGEACTGTSVCPYGSYCYLSAAGGDDKCTKSYSFSSGTTCSSDQQCKVGLYCDTSSGKCADRKGDGDSCTTPDGCFGKFFCDNSDPSGAKCRQRMSVDEGGTAYSNQACKPGLEVSSNKCVKSTTASGCASAGTLMRQFCTADSTCEVYDCVKEYLQNREMANAQVNQDQRKAYEAQVSLDKCMAKASDGTATPNSMSPILIAMIAVAGALFLCTLMMTSLFLLARRRAALATASAAATGTAAKTVDDDTGDEELEEEPDLVDDGSEAKA